MLFKLSDWELLYLIMLGKSWGDYVEAINSPPCLTVHKYDRSLVPVSWSGGQDVSSAGNLEGCFVWRPDWFWRHLCQCGTCWVREAFLAMGAQQSLWLPQCSWCSTTLCVFLLQYGWEPTLKNRSTGQLIGFWNVMYKKPDIIAPGHAGEFFTNALFTTEF